MNDYAPPTRVVSSCLLLRAVAIGLTIAAILWYVRGAP